MNFVTLEFAAFLLVVLILGSFFQKRATTCRVILLCANFFFYACAGLALVPLLLAVSILNWGTARLLSSPHKTSTRKCILGVDIGIHIALLAFFKYNEFFLHGLELLLSALFSGSSGSSLTGMTSAYGLTDILFPVGLSFYTFQGLSYAIDQYRDVKPSGTFVEVLLYVSFFPTIMAGPILRFGSFAPQLDKRNYDSRSLQEGFALILSGLFKKVVIASYLSEHIVRDVYLTPEIYSSPAVLAAVYAYSIQIFCDFSGYSDMAIGIGRLMGFQLPENFHSPYLACNLQDFWRRWHISLSRWLRDYLYIPLGGSRRGNRYANLIITMTLGGLWHGSHARFLVWGVLHGMGLALVHAFHKLKPTLLPASLPPAAQFLGHVLSWLLTFHFVTILWVFFRAEDMDRSLEIIRRAFAAETGIGFPMLVIPAILAGFLVQLYGRRLFTGFLSFQERLPWYGQAIVLALVGGFILKMGPDGVMPFIYFQF